MDGARVEFPGFKSAAGREAYFGAYDAALAAWPIPHRSVELATRFGATHVVASGRGEGPALLLLPSFAATATAWRANAEALGAQFRLFAVDVIGQPGRSRTNMRLKTREEFAAWLTEVMDGLGLARAGLVGASFGGFLALSQAMLTPERVDKVAMIGPAGGFAGISPWVVALMLTGALRRRARSWFSDRPPSIGDVLGIRSAHAADEAWRRLMSVTLEQSPRSFAIQAPVFGAAELARIEAPMLLLIGEHERLYDAAATLRRAQRLAPRLQGEIVPGGDHLAAMSQPEFVNRQLLAFLRN